MDTNEKGGDERMARNKNYKSTQANRDNRANQLNKNNPAFWQARGHDKRPDGWESRSDNDSSNQK